MELEDKHFYYIREMTYKMGFGCRNCHYGNMENNENKSYTCGLRQHKPKILNNGTHFCSDWEKELKP